MPSRKIWHCDFLVVHDKQWFASSNGWKVADVFHFEHLSSETSASSSWPRADVVTSYNTSFSLISPVHMCKSKTQMKIKHTTVTPHEHLDFAIEMRNEFEQLGSKKRFQLIFFTFSTNCHFSECAMWIFSFASTRGVKQSIYPDILFPIRSGNFPVISPNK
jgi:hypothetical protein